MEVPFIHITRQEDIERLGLANKRRAICGMLDDPTLINFKRGSESGFLMFVQTGQMLD